MKHCLSVNDFTENDLKLLLASGREALREDFIERSLSMPLQGARIALWFDEPSTRTSLSFEVAARQLGAEVVRIDEKKSSAVKGESWSDTAAVLAEIGCDALVVRTTAPEVPAALAEEDSLPIINAGNGCVEHPTQALGDLLCLEMAGYLSTPFRIAIVGDIAHSRVANSHFHLLPKCGIDVISCAPHPWLPQHKDMRTTSSLDEALCESSVAMYLRVQKERHEETKESLFDEFIEHYQLRPKHFAQYSSLKMVMHPGPVNWGVELFPTLRNSPKCAVLKQVRCGVAMRIALLKFLLTP